MNRNLWPRTILCVCFFLLLILGVMYFCLHRYQTPISGIKYIPSSRILVVGSEHKTIQAAIDAAGRGDIVRITKGIYEESLTLKDGVSLEGEDINSVIIQCDVREAPVLTIENCTGAHVTGVTLTHIGAENLEKDFEGRWAVLKISQSSVQINNCLVYRSSSNGIRIEDSNDVTIKRCTVRDNKFNGILVCNHGRSRLENNTCTSNGINGIYFIGWASGLAQSNVCKQNGYHGISIGDNAKVELLNNVCSDNKTDGIWLGSSQICKGIQNLCQSNGKYGIYASGSGTNVFLEKNQCSNNALNGIYFWGGAGGEVKANTCIKNGGHGISTEDNCWPHIEGNECADNNRCGIYLSVNARVDIPPNTIRNNGEISFGEIHSLVKSEQFDKLEEIASRLRKEKRQFSNANWQLAHFYFAAGIPWGSANQDENVLHKWIAKYPVSITPRITLATLYKAEAWEARGGDWASTVSEKGWQIFNEKLRKAEEILLEAEKLDMKDPHLYEVWLNVGNGLRKSSEEMDALFEKGIAIERLYYPLYETRAYALLPRWGGEKGQFEAFARHAVELTQPQEGQSLYRIIASSVLFTVDANEFKTMGFSYQKIKEASNDLFKKYPKIRDSSFDNASCFFACMFDDKDRANKLFLTIDRDWDMRLWRTEAVFNTYKNWALRRVPDTNSTITSTIEQKTKTY